MFLTIVPTYYTLEIKNFVLGCRIKDMELWDEPNFELKVKVYKVLTASITMEVKNNHAASQPKEF